MSVSSIPSLFAWKNSPKGFGSSIVVIHIQFVALCEQLSKILVRLWPVVKNSLTNNGCHPVLVVLLLRC